MKNLGRIRASWDGSELTVELSMAGLQDLIDCLKTQAFGTYQLSRDHGLLHTLELVSSTGKLKLSITDACARLGGNSHATDLLVDNLEGLLASWASGDDLHYHFDPASDRLLMEQDSEAFIISSLPSA